MLAIADADGMVSASLPGLASVSNVSLEAAEKAVSNLKSPDLYSRTKDNEGRRIEEVDGGWLILNYQKYRRMLNEEERKEYKAKWIKTKRRQMSTMSTRVDEHGQMSTLPSASASSSVSESEWLKELSTDKAYEGINVQREHSKALRWAKENKVVMTRRRFVNWLNKADRNLGNGSIPDKPMTKYGFPLPDGCTIRRDGEVLDYSGRVMDVNQVRNAIKAEQRVV